MPNRILRDGILTSPRVCKLGWAEEVFYRRLMSVVDDYGRYYADPGMLRAACYPRQLSKVTDADLGKWTRILAEAGLVSVYAHEGEQYLELVNFGQQVRAKSSKFPDPPSTCVADAKQMLANEHLDVVVDVVVDGDVVDSARARRKKLDAPTEEHERIAAERGISCEAEWAKYRDWLAANGKRHADEVAGFRNWLRNAKVVAAPFGRQTTLAEKRAANIAALTGQVRHEREVFAERVGGAAIPALPGDLRQSDDDDVGRRTDVRSQGGMG